MKKIDIDNEFEFEGEAAAVCDTCAAVMADIYKAVFLQEVAKIKFEPTDKDHAVSSADFDRVVEAAGRARCVAQIGLEEYRDGMRRIAEQID